MGCTFGIHSPSSSTILLHLALLFIQLCMAGHQIITRVALLHGMSPFPCAVYRGLIGLSIISPFAFFCERTKRPALTWRHLGHFFHLGLTGIFLVQAFHSQGLRYTSPMFAAAINNSISSITFIIAVLLGQETAHIRRRHGQAKVCGTILSIIGATLMVLYKGPALLKVTGESIVTNAVNNDPILLLCETSLYENMAWMKKWQFGAFYHLGMCIAFSVWLVTQTRVVKEYPACLSVTAFTSFFGTLQLLVLAVSTERSTSKWILPWGTSLLSVLYGGLVLSGLLLAVQMWCVQKGGPVLVAMYHPGQAIITGVFSLFLGEDFYLGSLIGGILIVGGLYLVTWGQGMERKIDPPLPTSSANESIKSKSSLTHIFFDGKNWCSSRITEPLLDEKTLKDGETLSRTSNIYNLNLHDP